jgi:rRNA maturation RNase YbeY
MLAVAVAAQGTRAPVSGARVRALAQQVLRAERVTNALISIAFVTPLAMARLNRRHRGHRGPTDVIAFAFRRTGRRSPLVGDIYIAPAVARRNAEHHGVGVREEVARLVVHGLLHVAGHDHPAGATRTVSPMWRRQERLLRRLYLARP